jgi:hypothetical protein
MADFKPFSKLVHDRFTLLSKNELFVTVDGNAVWEKYLASFPDGTNPIYKERTEHDCSCCKQFVRNIGNVVAVIDGKLQSVWGIIGAEEPYQTVADALNAFVTSQAITSLFRTSEPSYGAVQTKQLLAGGAVLSWEHFYGKVDAKHYTKTVGQKVGDYNTTVQVFERGLTELSVTAMEEVIDLIKSNALYRGEEHLPALREFYKAKKGYDLLSQAERNSYVWLNAGLPVSRFRNTVIGTLIQDLSSGVDLEQAVKSFETKVAPTNYKRPTALITPRMIQDAMKTINEAGLTEDLERRFAKISDVSVNNVLWVDNSVAGQMQGNIESLLMGAATAPVAKAGAAEPIGIEDFVSKVLPLVHSMEMLVQGQHTNNFVSLTAPVHGSTGKLFKWANDFGWSYDGNIADSELRRAVQARGGRVDGVFRFSHSWNYGKRNASLMDLHVFMPGNKGIKADNGINDVYGNHERVGWNNRQHNPSGGIQDVDYVQAAPAGYVPVENITFPSISRMPEGTYICKIHNWNLRQPTTGGFKAEIEFGGQVFQYEHDKAMKHKEWITVAEVTLKDGAFTIKHHMQTGCASRDVWNVKTETFVKVNTMLLSPNYWDESRVGNKHHFFILEGCKNPEPARGIYNEFLNSSLEKHRKVFEVLGDKTKCAVADEQLSGLGFSSTRGDTVTVKVKGPKLNKQYLITF